MTKQEIIDNAYQFFIDTYQIKFNGVIELDMQEGFYNLKIYLNEQWFRPINIMYETDNVDEFIIFMRKDLYNRKLYLHDATKITSIKLTPEQI